MASRLWKRVSIRARYVKQSPWTAFHMCVSSSSDLKPSVFSRETSARLAAVRKSAHLRRIVDLRPGSGHCLETSSMRFIPAISVPSAKSFLRAWPPCDLGSTKSNTASTVGRR